MGIIALKNALVILDDLPVIVVEVGSWQRRERFIKMIFQLPIFYHVSSHPVYETIFQNVTRHVTMKTA